jgi:hypothetical protein
MPARLPESGQSIPVHYKDYRDGEGDLVFHVALVGGTFNDADGAPWVFLTGRRLSPDGVGSSAEETIPARVSGVELVPASAADPSALTAALTREVR